tara:strand:+ start:241 stop:432 length:192 start_codon:yes stop_codon:yes gene_type:complete
MNNLNKFYWNEDTLDHFKFESSYLSKDEVIKNIVEFILFECSLEDGETDEMLVEDLKNRIFTN